MNADTPTQRSMLDCLLHAANVMSRWAIWVAGALMMLTVFYIVADIFSRILFTQSLYSDELSGYAFAISVAWALSFATLQRANIRIDALYQLLPTRICALLDWISLVALGVFIAYLTRYAANVALVSWNSNSHANSILATPLWIPHVIWTAGFVWLCVVLALMLLRSSVALVQGPGVSSRGS